MLFSYLLILYPFTTQYDFAIPSSGFVSSAPKILPGISFFVRYVLLLKWFFVDSDFFFGKAERVENS